MKIVVAIDSFKGSASSMELNTSVADAIHQLFPDWQVATFAIADGGEGTLEALSANLDGEWVEVATVDLMGIPICASYFMVGKTAFMESAKVIGLDKVIPSPTSFEQATSFGLGALIKDAVARGCREIMLSLGGTGTSDGGLGLLKSLGFDGNNLATLPLLDGVRLIGLADVANPYAGEHGFAAVFGPQKGGTAEQIAAVDARAQQFVAQVKEQNGLDLQAVSGTGAAGGLGGALVLLGGQLQSGFSYIASNIGLLDALQDADLVITGEGRLDAQSKAGKVPVAIAQAAKRYGVSTIAICGAIPDDERELEQDFLALYAIQKGALSLEEAMEKERTLRNIAAVTRNIFKTRFL